MAAQNDPSEQLVVEVFVSDIERSLEFYRALGFVQIGDAAEGGFAILAWEASVLFLQELEVPPVERPQANVRVMVDDVDAYWQRAIELGATVYRPIDDREYGLRDFIIADPDGFALRFATLLGR